MNTITEQEIYQKLMNHYGSGVDRELVKNERLDGYRVAIGSVVYSLCGSPPKGYAIAIPEHRLVSLYDGEGERFQILRDTVVAELE